MYSSTQSSPKDHLPQKLLALPTSFGVEMIDCLSLIRIEAVSNYCKLFFTNGKTLVVAKVLAWFEDRLGDKGFIRLHRSHLVNMQFILRLNNERKAEVVLKNSFNIPVSRRKKQQCRQTILQFYNAHQAGTLAA
jgi:two-component system, LytTR family, response regulator